MSEQTNAEPPPANDEPPPLKGEITEHSLKDRYEAILKYFQQNDPMAVKLRKEVEIQDELVKRHAHYRHLAVLSLANHAAELRRMAEDQLRKEAGTRILPGFKRKESEAQFRAKLHHREKLIQAQIRRVERMNPILFGAESNPGRANGA